MAASSALKSEALSWLRYIKQYPIVCTEVGSWNSDALGISPAVMAEIEVKVTLSDLRAEFKNKRAKHHRYWLTNEGERAYTSVPNYYYVMLPAGLIEEAKLFLTDVCPKAGILSYHTLAFGRTVFVARKPVKIHDLPPSRYMVRMAVRRMSSEICGLWHTQEQLAGNISAMLDTATQSIAAANLKNEGVLDTESEEVRTMVLEARAKELCRAMEGAAWDTLGTPERAVFLKAAKTLADGKGVNLRDWAVL